MGWSEDESTSYTGESTRFVPLRFLLPASYITGAGLVMAWFGWNSTWILTLYVFLAIGLASVKVLTSMSSTKDFQALYFASVYILLNIPLL